MAFYQTAAPQHQQYSSPFSIPNHQYSPLAGGVSSVGGLGGMGNSSYHPSPLMMGSGSSPSQMETSSYLPSYLLGGPSSQSPNSSPQRHRRTPYYHSPQKVNVSPSPMSISYSSRANNKYNTERNHDIKPGGPPVQSLHEHTKSPVGTQSLFGSGGVSSSPERRQLNFTGTKSIPPFNISATPSYINSPANKSVTTTNTNGGGVLSFPSSPSQMDPFYTQGDELTSDHVYNDHWVTIFGFPPASSSYIMEQFSQYGSIVSHKMLSEGNWMHLQYQTKLQAKKALSKNGKIYSDGIMVGVQPCIDKSIIHGVHSSTPIATPTHSLPQSILTKKPSTMRPLTAAYQASSSAHDVSPDNPNTPQKSSGFISRTLEYVFGW